MKIILSGKLDEIDIMTNIVRKLKKNISLQLSRKVIKIIVRERNIIIYKYFFS